MQNRVVEVGSAQKAILADLFEKLDDSLILSCIQNYFGKAWVDSIENPQSGKIVVSDFCFLAGKPDEEVLTSYTEAEKPQFLIMIADNEGWYKLIEKLYPGRFNRTERYGIKKEGDIFDRELLQSYIDKIDAKYTVRLVEEKDYPIIMKEEWSKSLCESFHDAKDYIKRGFGAIALDGDTIVAGASTYTCYKEGIEIEIDTREDYRRQGLALACGAKIILESLQRGLYPNWDAQNMMSVGVAQKLGYHYAGPYTVYEVW